MQNDVIGIVCRADADDLHASARDQERIAQSASRRCDIPFADLATLVAIGGAASARGAIQRYGFGSRRDTSLTQVILSDASDVSANPHRTDDLDEGPPTPIVRRGYRPASSRRVSALNADFSDLEQLFTSERMVGSLGLIEDGSEGILIKAVG